MRPRFTQVMPLNALPNTRMKRLFFALATVLLAGCDLNTTAVEDNPSDPATETYATGLNINISQFTKTANGVYYKDLTVGTGAVLTGAPTVQFDYAGLLTNGTVFDSGKEKVFVLSQLIYGMQEGMQGMREGGERMIIIPSELGYGNTTGLAVPPNSTILFDVRLILLP